MKQFLVDLIVRFWLVMPRRARLWAFMHDGVDSPVCLRTHPQGYDWPTCRGCGAPTCERHRVPGSLKEGERDRSYGDYTVAEHWETVECLACFSEAMNARFEEKQRP